MSVMLYKKGESHKLHGFDVDYIIVDEDEVSAKQKDGWVKTPAETEKKPRAKKVKPAETEGNEGEQGEA